MSNETNPEHLRHERRKGTLLIFGSISSISGGISALNFVHSNNLETLPALGLRLPAVISVAGGAILGAVGISRFINNETDGDEGNPGNGGGGGWTPPPDMPLPSGGGLDLTPDDFITDYICHPSVQANPSKPEHQLL